MVRRQISVSAIIVVSLFLLYETIFRSSPIRCETILFSRQEIIKFVQLAPDQCYGLEPPREFKGSWIVGKRLNEFRIAGQTEYPRQLLIGQGGLELLFFEERMPVNSHIVYNIHFLGRAVKQHEESRRGDI